MLRRRGREQVGLELCSAVLSGLEDTKTVLTSVSSAPCVGVKVTSKLGAANADEGTATGG